MTSHLILDDHNFAEVRTQVSDAVRSGAITVLAAEHGYVYICDAFNRDRVSRIHALRGDAPFTAAQVMVSHADVLKGVATDFDADLSRITDRFWPGLLTLQLTPHYGLSWNLGDEGELDYFAVRAPARELLRAVIELTGPVAVASAGLVGQGAVRSLSEIPSLAADIAIVVDEGQLPEGRPSTLIGRSSQGGLRVIREGAISRVQLAELVPTIGA